jgi:hypothetical protein
MFFPPDSFDSLMVDMPTDVFQCLMNSWTTVPGFAVGNTSHLGKQFPLIRWSTTLVTLGCAWLTEHTTSSTF